MPNQKWPKIIPELSTEQQQIRDDFMKYWLQVLPGRFGIIEQFNHRYPLRTFKNNVTTLEIGAGLGTHLRFENHSQQKYVALELRSELTCALAKQFPGVQAITGDCQKRIDFEDHYFDRVIAVHVLEHLPDLPSAISEVKRVLKPDGDFCVLIPCDPGFAYSIARNISARRIFEERYHQSYDWCIRSEHLNTPSEIMEELLKHFSITHRLYFPTIIPVKDLNLVIGLTLKPRTG